jgi:hypothetical protein
MNAAFYGEEKEQTVTKILATLYDLTGSMDCAEELVNAADEVERTCAGAAITLMPPWIN